MIRRGWTVAVAAISCMALLGACTGEDAPPPPTGSTSGASTSSTSGSSTSSPTTSPGTDQSAAMLAAQLPAPQGSITGTVDRQPVTLNVGSVRATAGSTVLTFWFTGAKKLLAGHGEYSWERMPVLVDPVGKQVYEPLTFTDQRGKTACLCTDAAYVRGEPQPRTILYPALPASISSIAVRHAGFPRTVSIPVTR